MGWSEAEWLEDAIIPTSNSPPVGYEYTKAAEILGYYCISRRPAAMQSLRDVINNKMPHLRNCMVTYGCRLHC